MEVAQGAPFRGVTRDAQCPEEALDAIVGWAATANAWLDANAVTSRRRGLTRRTGVEWARDTLLSVINHDMGGF